MSNFKPILFFTEMVQSILDGRKTQTRRLVDNPVTEAMLDFATSNDKEISLLFKNAKYQPSDILWVRETFEYSDDLNNPYLYYQNELGEWTDEYFATMKWKPSIHMPKEAARIFLKVTSVRAERLQDISEEDAVAEGVEKYGPFGEYKGEVHPNGGMMRFRAYSNASRAFQDIWQKINGKKNPWESNPWVWVYTFERIEKPENFK